MKAVYLVPTRSGGVYEYREVAQPSAKGARILVKVRAAGTNRGEILMVSGYNSRIPSLKPVPSGIEFAGEIVAVGDDATGWHVGERVMGRAPGSYAEYVLTGGAQLMRIPENLSWVEAAAIPNVFLTAHDAIVSNAEFREGERMVVTAASSGIGTASIALARLLGAETVIATTRDAAKVERLLDVGADVVIVTSEPGYADKVREATEGEGADVIIDSVGGPMLADNLDALAVRGRLVTVGRNAGNRGECDLDLVAYKRAAIIGTTFRTRSMQESVVCFERFADDCLAAFASGHLKPALDRVFPFDALGDAHRYMLADGQIGKIVIAMDD